jgi:membrane protein YqaA with SNARE-associated domain
MSEWWQVLVVAFSGGFLGGVVAYYLETGARWRARLWGHHRDENHKK